MSTLTAPGGGNVWDTVVPVSGIVIDRAEQIAVGIEPRDVTIEVPWESTRP